MRQFITLAALAAALIAVGCSQVPDKAPVAFRSVMIQSHPKGWGYAHKTVQKGGIITGGHLSGGPEAVRVYETQSEVTSEDMSHLASLVARTLQSRPKSALASPDQKSEGYKTIVIRFEDEMSITAHSKWDQHFESADLQSIWDLVYKYNVGAW